MGRKSLFDLAGLEIELEKKTKKEVRFADLQFSSSIAEGLDSNRRGKNHMKKKPGVFVKHILESVESIEEFTKGFSKKEFLKSRKTQDAVIRRVEIMGEATKNLPKRFRDKHPEVF